MKRKKIILWSLGILLLAGSAGGYYAWKEYNRQHRDTADLKADYSASALSLLEEFGKNEQASNTRYLGKVLKVQGQVKELLKDEKGFFSVVLGDSTAMSSVRCSMDSLHNQEAASLLKGAKVTVQGICTGYNADELLGSDLLLTRSVIFKD